MYHYSILEPFKFNWKYAAPKSFTEMEYFITPTLSIGVDRMSNGKNDFAIGAYLTESKNTTLFANEYLVKRSQERVKLAFDKEEISVFFTPKEAEEMDLLFEEERFIARQVKVYSNNIAVDVFSLSETDFSLVMEVFSELGVQQSINFKTEKESFEDLRKDMYEQAFHKAKEAFTKTRSKREFVTKKKLYTQAAVGASLLLSSATLGVISKKLVTKGFFGIIGSGVAKLASVVCGIAGLKFVNGATDYYTEGVVFE